MQIRARTYKKAIEELLCVAYDGRAKMRMRTLEEEGFSESGICYAISQEREQLWRYRNEPHFWSMVVNAVRKRCWDKNDPSDKQQEDTSTGGCVYFLQGANGGPIKIGYSKDVSKRIKELQTGFPSKLTVLAMAPGSRRTEAELHRKFKAHRLQGEWFRPAQELLAYIKGINGGNQQVMVMG